jgi:AbrB family looped-hinge helix DNA binding protein
MSAATLTSKGQITLPKPIRDRLGLRAGDRVSFREREDGTIVLEAERRDALALFGMLKPRRRGVTLAEMDAAVARGAARR